jgi:hypothetical protein
MFKAVRTKKLTMRSWSEVERRPVTRVAVLLTDGRPVTY